MDLTLEDESTDSEYANVDDGGVMLVEDSEDERENMPPPPPIVQSATPLLSGTLPRLRVFLCFSLFLLH
jgi:hypothetical protein